ncbi:S41 family peptidase [Pollutibacter soli]|uniref:S41 family peptidase n=1 Tax=Pollutibacter soli TaxID=3034157 RepID=UPI0030132E48
MSKSFVFILINSFITATAFSQNTRLLRDPDISEKQVVFSYANDLWIADKNGGEARRLTSFQGSEFNPRFSPDGSMIAYSGQYNGNVDVYVIPSIGGEPKRLTWHPGSDVVNGWTPAGKVLFASMRESVPGGGKMWEMGIGEGFPHALKIPRAYRGEYSEDGKFFAYELVSPWDEEWRNYRGGQNRPIWVQDMSDNSIKTLPWENSHDMQPVWLKGKIYFLSDRDLAMNLYSFDPQTSQVEQLTTFSEFDIKQLSAGGGSIVFEYGGDIYTFDPSVKASKKLAIQVRGDFPWLRPQYKNVSNNLDKASLSPGGKRVVFEARGEIITVPAEKGDARNITNAPGSREHDPVWSPDGKSIAWFSDASGEYSLMIGSQSGIEKAREIKIPSPTFYYSPTWSPDGKYIAFTDHIQQLWMTEIASGKTTLVDKDSYLHPDRTINPVWSPDSKWIGYTKRLPSQYHVIMAYEIAKSKSLQLTDGMSDAISPAWDASGKYLYFLASTNLALASGWLDMSSLERPVRRSVYFMVLKKGDPSPLLPESDEEEKDKDQKTVDSTVVQAKKSTKKTDEKAKTSEESKALVQIDLDGLSQRILSTSMTGRDYTNLKAGVAGEIFVLENVKNQPGQTLYKYTLKSRKEEKYADAVSYFTLSTDGKKILFHGAQWVLTESTAVPAPGSGTLNVSGVQIYSDARKEWKQIFREAWRYQRDYLYVRNVHGNDWNKIYEKYSPLVDFVAHRNDLNYLLDILGGEVSIGHSFVGGGDLPTTGYVNNGLLGADLETAGGRYRIKKIYNGENWNPGLRSPLSTPGVDVNNGDYILAVDGINLTDSMNPYSLFENKADKQVSLRVSKTADGKSPRNVIVVPVANEYSLRLYDWVEGNRRKVDSLSGGKLAYVWLPNTAEDGYDNFNRYYFAQQDKQGVILDERYNGGGFIADYFVDILSRQLRGYFNNVSGEQRPWTEPLTGIFGPKVMIINEMAGSGGDMLPYLFKQMKIGPLVGKKTWGGLVGIWDTPELMDGGYITAPRGGFFDLNGKWDVEGVGITPDIDVEMTPKEVLAGHDPQLERAVEEALRLLKDHPVQLQKEPAAPVRALRPKK